MHGQPARGGLRLAAARPPRVAPHDCTWRRRPTAERSRGGRYTKAAGCARCAARAARKHASALRPALPTRKFGFRGTTATDSTREASTGAERQTRPAPRGRLATPHKRWNARELIHAGHRVTLPPNTRTAVAAKGRPLSGLVFGFEACSPTVRGRPLDPKSRPQCGRCFGAAARVFPAEKHGFCKNRQSPQDGLAGCCIAWTSAAPGHPTVPRRF